MDEMYILSSTAPSASIHALGAGFLCFYLYRDHHTSGVSPCLVFYKHGHFHSVYPSRTTLVYHLSAVGHLSCLREGRICFIVSNRFDPILPHFPPNRNLFCSQSSDFSLSGYMINHRELTIFFYECIHDLAFDLCAVVYRLPSYPGW